MVGDAAHAVFYGPNYKPPAPGGNPDSQLVQANNGGIGVTPYHDADGNVISPGTIIQDAVVGAAVQIVTLPIGGPEEEGAYAAADAALKAADAAKIAAKCKSFSSFDALKRAYPNTPGNVWHHIVEQSQERRFGADAIQNIDNVIEVTPDVNHKLNVLYSSKRPDITGPDAQTVRQWLGAQTLHDAQAFGIKAVMKVSNGTWP
jgi:hypothetical protein